MKPRLLSVLCLSLALPAGAEIRERIIAMVNGDIITLSDIENRQMAAVQAAGVPNDRIPAFLRENGGRIVQDAIDELLVYQKGDEMGIAERVTAEYMDNVIKDIKKDNHIENDDVFRAQLAREGLTLEGLKRNIKRSIVRQQVVHQLIEAKIVVAEADTRAEYARRRAEYTKAASVRLQEIVLKAESPAARGQAEELVRRARAGEDFGALAKEHSTSPTRVSGGDLGSVVVAELHSALRSAIASVEVGQVSEPISVAGTIRVLKVNERTEARTVPYEEAREDLIQKLKRDRAAKEAVRLVEDLRKDSVIEMKVREAPVATDVQVPTEPMLRDPAVSSPLPDSSLPSAKPAGASDDEFTVSPQAAPRTGGPGTVAPAGTPTPKPEAPPSR